MLLLSAQELRELTGYAQPSKQLAELIRLGFWRARRARTGAVILERSHYDAVTQGRAQAANDTKARPRVRA